MNEDMYVKDGKEYDRVTKVINYFMAPGLVDWRVKVGKKEANKIMRDAAKIGTRVHRLAEDHNYGEGEVDTAKEKPEVKTAFGAYIKWIEEYDPAIKTMEKTVYSEEWGIAGTYDILLEDRAIVDIKTSRMISPTHWIQLAAYAQMEGDIQAIAVLRLDKNLGVYEYKVREFEQYYVDVFVSLLNAYRYYKHEEERNGSN